MPLNNILPQYQAEERSAEVRVRPVPMPNHMDMAGRLLSQAGGDIQKVAFGVALDMKRRKDETDEKNRALMMSEKTAAMTTNITKRVTELVKLQGTEAAGITGTFEKDFQNELNRQSSGLGIEDMRKFRAWANQLYLSSWKSVNGHEYQQTTQANIQLRKENAGQLRDTYTRMGDADSLAQFEGGCTQLWEAMGRSTDAPEYEVFMRENRDQAISSRIDFLLRQGKAEDALDYYQRMTTRLSSTAKAQVEPRLVEASNDRINRGSAASFLFDINQASGDKSLSGRYPSPARTQAYARKDQELAASSDPNDKIKRQYLRELFQADTAVKEANLSADYTELTSKMAVEDTWGNVLSNISYLDFLLPTMPDSELKDQLQMLHNKLVSKEQNYSDAYQSELKAKTAAEKADARERAEAAKAAYTEWEKDPVRQAMAGQFKTAAARSDHTAYFNGMPFDLRDPGKRAAFFMATEGILTEQDKRLITEIAAGRYSTGVHSAACYDISQYLKALAPKFNWTQENVNLLMPELVDEYMAKRAEWTNNGEVKGKELKAVEDQLQQWLIKKLTEERDNGAGKMVPAWKFVSNAFDTDGAVRWFVNSVTDETGRVVAKAATTAWQAWESRKNYGPSGGDTADERRANAQKRAELTRVRKQGERNMDNVVFGGMAPAPEPWSLYGSLDALGGK